MNIKTVAALAGVSPSTVSRVLSGNDYVNAETRQRVLKAIEQTGYTPNSLAASLKKGTSNTICLFVPSIQNMIFPIITRGVEDTARKNGFTVVLCNTDEDCEVEKEYIGKMKTRWIDGFIMCGMIPKAEYVRDLRKEGFPLVLVNRFEPQDEGKMDIVSVDNFRAAYDATEYLIRTGRRRIAFAMGAEELWFYRERRRGYRAALEDHGISYQENFVMCETTKDEGFYYRTQELMRLPKEKRPDAVFCSSDPKAFDVLHALHDAGIRIPKEVSVMGFDNVELSAIIEPPLTTVHQPLYEMGVAAADRLIREIRYKEKNGTLPQPVHEVMDTTLIVRKSTE